MKPLPILELFGEWRAFSSLNKSCERKIPFMKTRWWILASYLSIVKSMHHSKWLHLPPNLQGENGENKIQKDTALKKIHMYVRITSPKSEKELPLLMQAINSFLALRIFNFQLISFLKKNFHQKKMKIQLKTKKNHPKPLPQKPLVPPPLFLIFGYLQQ